MDLTHKQKSIKECAVRIFRKKGFTQTTMEDIGDMMNMKAGSLYSHIKTKNQILMWICDEIDEQLHQVMQDVNAFSGNDQEKLKFFIYRHFEEILKNKYQYEVFLRSWKLVDKKKKKQYQLHHKAYIDFATSLVKKVTGHINLVPCLQEDALTVILMQILNHIPRWIAQNKEQYLELITDDVLHKFMYGHKPRT